jgi:hypothetical protein
MLQIIQVALSRGTSSSKKPAAVSKYWHKCYKFMLWAYLELIIYGFTVHLAALFIHNRHHNSQIKLNLPAFCRTEKFMIMFTATCQFFLGWSPSKELKSALFWFQTTPKVTTTKPRTVKTTNLNTTTAAPNQANAKQNQEDMAGLLKLLESMVSEETGLSSCQSVWLHGL